MKEFFKMMFASALGVFVASALLTAVSIVLTGMMLVSLGSGMKSTYTPNPGECIFRISLSGTLYDTVEENPFAVLLGSDEALSLRDILTAIQRAEEQPFIKGIYLDVGMFSAGTSSLDAIRRALVGFRQSGKFVVAYADSYSQGGYYLASVADRVYMNPQGILGLTGLASQTLFYKGLMEKAGIRMNVFKVGTYKGAVEPFTGDKLSEANREQITSYLNGIWNHVVQGIAESRKIAEEEIHAFADGGYFFANPSKAVEYGLVDELKYRSEAEEALKEMAGQEGDSRMKTVGVSRMKNAKKAGRKYHNKIAVVYAEGEIIQSAPSSVFLREKYITEKLGDELKKLKSDENVKAVVLRVNSPGGSAYTSDQIWKQVAELEKKKPVVVSMGNVAASGGYYISCAATKIVAEANTLTGSIGVFGMFPDASGLFDKLALTADVVKTNSFADLGDMSRPMTNDEKALVQGYVERCYDTFLTRCAEGRNMTKEDIDAIGQGRVWTGKQAMERGLVDELGGLDRAVELAAELAGIYNYTLIDVSTVENFFKEFMEGRLDGLKVSVARELTGEDYEYFRTLQQIRTTYGIQARIPFDMKPL
ncbi:MAG: signal peptide peptidase SppA [Tannerella sp.]|nr:signal peptide peptidase SppA [Tannerella sp.]